MIISKVEATGYRCLRDVKQELQPYQILVGPNGSGKSVFLDVIGFLGDLVTGGLKEAVAKRTDNFYDLVWGRAGKSFRLAVEAQWLPDDRTAHPSDGLIRYEIEATIDAKDDKIAISSERLTITEDSGNELPVLIHDGRKLSFAGKLDLNGLLRLKPPRDYSGLAALGNLGIEETDFRVMSLYNLLSDGGIKTVALDDASLLKPSPPIAGRSAVYEGSELARLASQLQESSHDVFKSWVEHVQTAIPDLVNIRPVLFPDDRRRYLMVEYTGGLEVPQWMLSDGTLRLLALTLLAYLPDFHGLYLVEEPEIGLHPTAIETVMQSLSSVYDGQVLITSHSPLVLSLPRPDQLLCFQKTENGTTIIPGNEHPMLSQWKSGVNISDLFAAGVLG